MQIVSLSLQVDMEMAFVREEDVMAELEVILGGTFAKMGISQLHCARFSTGTQWILTAPISLIPTLVWSSDVSEVFKQSGFDSLALLQQLVVSDQGNQR